ncbi:MAG: hypothetical protein JOY58_02775 [Solirubrobacterales bacterium]|nr:hypothetical protein [Solirubrobacterales bacterium]
MRARVRTQVLCSVGSAVHDVALAALLGGNLFGRLAMNPALADISDKAERGKVLNRARRRYGTVDSIALVALVAGWLPARLDRADMIVSRRQWRLTVAKDVAIGSVVVTGLASAAGGVGFAQQAPDGAVPMQSGSAPAPETPPRAAALKRVVGVLGALNIFSELVLAIINTALSPVTGPSRPVRRVLARRS